MKFIFFGSVKKRHECSENGPSFIGMQEKNRGNSIDLKEQILKYIEILKETHGDISSQERNFTQRL